MLEEARAGSPDRYGDATGPITKICRFLLSATGAPIASTDPHGGSLEWIGGRYIAVGKEPEIG